MIELKEIRAGLSNGEFFLVYLPIVSLTDGRCTGGEALLRWRRNGMVIPPDRFIPAAENTPLSGLLTYWVIDTVAEELGQWLRAHSDARVSINVPPEVFGRGGLEYAARKAGVADLYRQVVLEVTERGIPDHIGLNALNGMARAGVRIALDDLMPVGLNLAVLTRGGFDMVKLDRKMVSEIQPGADAPRWLASVAALASSGSIEVIAEGIETQLQRDTLRDAGVRAGQGFFFSHPLPLPAFIDFHARSNGGREAPV